MKKKILLAAAMTAVLFAFTACGSKKTETQAASEAATQAATETQTETQQETEAAVDAKAALDQVSKTHASSDAFAARIQQNIHNQADADHSADYDLDGNIAVSGLTKAGSLVVAITDGKDADHNNEFYSEGHYYSTFEDLKIKYALSEELMKSYLASFTFDGLDSQYMTEVTRTENGANVVYNFTADMNTIQDYISKVLPDIEDERAIHITSMTGTITTDTGDKVLSKQIVSTYTATLGKEINSYTNTLSIKYDTNPAAAEIKLPDLSEYILSDSTEGLPVHEQSKTIYTTTELNMRSKYTTSSVVMTTFPAYTQLKQTGYTDNGWIQVSFNDTVGFVHGAYVSEKEPFKVTEAKGSRWLKQDCYTYVSPSYYSPATALAAKDTPIEITGITDNNWAVFKFDGNTCYVPSDVLTDKDPKAKEEEVIGDPQTVEGIVLGVSEESMQVRAEGALINIYFGNVTLTGGDVPAIGDEVEVTFHKQGDRYVFDSIINHTAPNAFVMTGIVLGIEEDQMNIRAEGANITIYFKDKKIVPSDIANVSEGDEVRVTFHEEDGEYVFDKLNDWTPQ